MPSDAGHLDQARRNQAHAELLLREHAPDPTALQWAVIAAFYCAVHCIETYFATYGIHSRSHTHRESLMAKPSYNIPPDVYIAYGQLKQWSLQSRYQLRHFKPEMVRDTVLGHYLTQVTRFVGI
jgi:hypothetical protein